MFSGGIDISGLRRRLKIIGGQKISAYNVAVALYRDIYCVIALAENLQSELIGNAVVHIDFYGNILDFIFNNRRIFQRNDYPKNESDDN